MGINTKNAGLVDGLEACAPFVSDHCKSKVCVTEAKENIIDDWQSQASRNQYSWSISVLTLKNFLFEHYIDSHPTLPDSILHTFLEV